MGLLKSEPNWKRQLLVVYCALSLVMSGCVHRRVSVQSERPTPHPQEAANSNQAAKPSSVFDYIRLVYQISEENSVESRKAASGVQGDREEMDRLRKEILADPGNLEKRKRMVNRLVERGILGEALSLLRELEELAPEDSSVKLAMARVWRQIGRADEALEYAQATATLDPGSAEARLLAGQILVEQDKSALAIAVLLKAVALDATSAQAEATLGRAYMNNRDWLQARLHLFSAVQMDDSLVEPKKDLALTLVQLGEREAALRCFREIHGSESEAWNQLGVALLSQKHWTEARKAFQQVLDIQPAHAQARLNLFEAESYLPIPAVVSIPSFKVFAEFNEQDEMRQAFSAESVTPLPLDQTTGGGIAYLPPWGYETPSAGTGTGDLFPSVLETEAPFTLTAQGGLDVLPAVQAALGRTVASSHVAIIPALETVPDFTDTAAADQASGPAFEGAEFGSQGSPMVVQHVSLRRPGDATSVATLPGFGSPVEDSVPARLKESPLSAAVSAWIPVQLIETVVPPAAAHGSQGGTVTRSTSVLAQASEPPVIDADTLAVLKRIQPDQTRTETAVGRPADLVDGLAAIPQVFLPPPAGSPAAEPVSADAEDEAPPLTIIELDRLPTADRAWAFVTLPAVIQLPGLKQFAALPTADLEAREELGVPPSSDAFTRSAPLRENSVVAGPPAGRNLPFVGPDLVQLLRRQLQGAGLPFQPPASGLDSIHETSVVVALPGPSDAFVESSQESEPAGSAKPARSRMSNPAVTPRGAAHFYYPKGFTELPLLSSPGIGFAGLLPAAKAELVPLTGALPETSPSRPASIVERTVAAIEPAAGDESESESALVFHQQAAGIRPGEDVHYGAGWAERIANGMSYPDFLFLLLALVLGTMAIAAGLFHRNRQPTLPPLSRPS